VARTFEEAKLALHDFLAKESKQRRSPGAPAVFKDARALWEASADADHTMSEQSRNYRRNAMKRLLKSWPELDAMNLRGITRPKCEAWSSKLASEVDAQYFNNILAYFKGVLKRGGIADDDASPLAEIKRMGIELVPPTLPEPDQFIRLIAEIETSGAGMQQECADFARFLAYSGCRLSEARAATWADVDLTKGTLIVHNAKVRRARNWKPTRVVPIIADMRALLERLQKANPKPEDSICGVMECEKSLVRACKIVGIPKLTHHDLRHLFATRCIESGVDIPTVSRWLGHSDGGALAMKVYGHLRDNHSSEMAAKVNFGAAKAA
jgi:integrase